MSEHSARRPSGTLLITQEFGPEVAVDTLQCAHCGGHFPVIRGSGTRRGWCLNCAKPTCGGEACLRCVPTEKMLERIERQAAKATRGY